MADLVELLPALSEVQRAQALERFTLMDPVLEEDISQVQVAYTHQVALSTVQLWIKHYREKGLAELTNNVVRSDKGTPCKLPQTAIQPIEGLASQTPPRSAASIHRQVTARAKGQGWNPFCYHRVYTTIKQLDPTRVTLAPAGAVASREDFDRRFRREATHANATGQTDYTPLDVWVLDERRVSKTFVSCDQEMSNEGRKSADGFT